MIALDCLLTRHGFTLDARFETSGRLVALFGPSGSGKSTLIRLIAGLERPERGHISIDGTPVVDTARSLYIPPHKRRAGLVLQDGHLLPHFDVRRNLSYGRFFTPPSERRIAFDDVVDTLGIGHLLDRKPSTLSGGERQRVAIGRALMSSPRLLLMDEPLASLDANRKLEILPFIERLRDEMKIPIVYVSHSIEEVARLAETVVRIDVGQVRAIGPPSLVLAPTALARAAERFEAISLLTGRVARIQPDYGVTILEHPAGAIVLPWRVKDRSERVQVAVRATNVTLSLGRPGNISIRTALSGKVLSVEMDRGPFALVAVELSGGDRVFSYVTRLAIEELGLDAGDEVFALLKTVAIDERGVTGLSIPDVTGALPDEPDRAEWRRADPVDRDR